MLCSRNRSLVLRCALLNDRRFFLESQVAQNDRPLYHEVAYSSLKVAHMISSDWLSRFGSQDSASKTLGFALCLA